MRTSLAATVAATVAAAGAIFGTTSPALAANGDTFNQCVVGCSTQTYGTVTWHDDAATVEGWLYEHGYLGSAKAVFEGFAGTTKVDSKTITFDDQDDPAGRPWVDFSFPLTNSTLDGGSITRVKVTVCWLYERQGDCSTQSLYKL